MFRSRQLRNAKPRRRSSPRRVADPGFTLVELLVALGLVSLLMLMFAQVFQVATGTMSTQRGIMENDQRARSLTTIITNDFKNRSMKTVMPFFMNEDDVQTNYPSDRYFDFSKRQGYLSISENDPLNSADDVLSFTVFRDAAAQPYYGRAKGLQSRGQPINLARDSNQPDADDAELFSNDTATSRSAEIVYFLRNGNLYRRVMLIRDPLNTGDDRQPNYLNSAGTSTLNFFNPNAAYHNPDPVPYPISTTSGDFWKDFDFSARIDSTNGARFTGNGLSSGISPLSNREGNVTEFIANPSNRFGHNSTVAMGNPREYVGNLFIGRFTHEETSHDDFNYPYSASAYGTAGNPMDPADTPATILHDADGDNVIDEFARGDRRGEDILLSNVHAFDVQVWDELVGDFVDVGNSAGDFTFQASTYGPGGPSGNRVYDTWHPKLGAAPPYRPVYNTAWSASATYKVGSVVIPTTPNGFAYLASSIVSLPSTSINSAQPGATEPSAWNTTYGGFTTDVNTTNNTQITWETIPTTKRVKSLKITIRYLDVTSDQMRQVSLIQSLLE